MTVRSGLMELSEGARLVMGDAEWEVTTFTPHLGKLRLRRRDR
jgi:hypothetical protein